MELITSQIQHFWDEQVTHAHMPRYVAADEGDQNRNQPWEMNICVGHKALSNQFSVPERCSPTRHIAQLFDHRLSVKTKTFTWSAEEKEW